MGNRRKPRQHERAVQKDEIRPHCRTVEWRRFRGRRARYAAQIQGYHGYCMLPSPSPPRPCDDVSEFYKRGSHLRAWDDEWQRLDWYRYHSNPSRRWQRRSQSAILEAGEAPAAKQSRNNRDWQFFSRP